MSIFIDTGVMVASFNSRDELHLTAKTLMQSVFDKAFGNAFTSDYVIDEGTTLTFARTHDRTLSNSFLENSLNSNSLFEILYTSEEDFIETAKEYLKEKELSFTDCSILVLMKKHGIKNIATFDSGFRKIKGISVIEK